MREVWDNFLDLPELTPYPGTLQFVAVMQSNIEPLLLIADDMVDFAINLLLIVTSLKGMEQSLLSTTNLLGFSGLSQEEKRAEEANSKLNSKFRRLKIKMIVMFLGVLLIDAVVIAVIALQFTLLKLYSVELTAIYSSWLTVRVYYSMAFLDIFKNDLVAIKNERKQLKNCDYYAMNTVAKKAEPLSTSLLAARKEELPDISGKLGKKKKKLEGGEEVSEICESFSSPMSATGQLDTNMSTVPVMIRDYRLG